MEERNSRLLLAIFLSFSIWMVINFIFFPPQKNPKPTKVPEQTEPPIVTPSNSETPKPKEEKVTDSKENIIPKKFSQPKKEVELKNFYVITSPFLVELSNKGGRIEKYFVKNYKDLDGKEVKIAKDASHEIEFNKEKYRAIEISRGQGFDFNLGYTEMEAIFSPYNQIPFEFDINEKELLYAFSSKSLDESFEIKKEYKFFPDENYFLFNLSFKNLTSQELSIASETRPIYLRSFGSLGPVKLGELNDRDIQHYFRYYYNDGSFKDSVDGVSNHG
ncbi:MAG: preprotein translocase YidC, partial [Candidatus Pacearchaeota archaeon]